MRHRVRDAEQIDGDVREMPVAVVDDQVEVDVVGLAEAAAGQRAGDPDAADERCRGDESAHEAPRHVDVVACEECMPAGTVRDRGGAVRARVLHDQPIDHLKVGGGRRPAHVGL